MNRSEAATSTETPGSAVGRLRCAVIRHPGRAFVVLTYALSWPLWVTSGVLGRTNIREPDLRWLLAQVGVFAPALAGMIVAACVEPGATARARRMLLCIYLPATLLGLSLATRGHASFTDIGVGWIAALALMGAWVLAYFARETNRLSAWPGPSASPRAVAGWTFGGAAGMAGLFLLGWLLAGPSAGSGPGPPAGVIVRDVTAGGLLAALVVNLSFGGSLGEEPGWRGAWLPWLLRDGGARRASVIISFWWALWHAPIDLGQGFGVSGIGALVLRQVSTLPLALLITWVTVRAGGSLLPAFAVHTVVNMMPDFLIFDVARYERAAQLFVLLAAAVALAVALADRRLDAPRTEPAHAVP